MNNFLQIHNGHNDCLRQLRTKEKKSYQNKLSVVDRNGYCETIYESMFGIKLEKVQKLTKALKEMGFGTITKRVWERH